VGVPASALGDLKETCVCGFVTRLAMRTDTLIEYRLLLLTGLAATCVHGGQPGLPKHLWEEHSHGSEYL
jgi:hypothetical protein